MSLRPLVRYAAGHAADGDVVASAWMQDPGATVERAVAHGLDVFVARAVGAQGGDPATHGPSDDAHEALAASARSTALAALGALAQTREVIDAARQAGIPVCTYKGPVLAYQAYGDAGARATSDLDLLISPAQMAGMSEVLSRLGYRPVVPARAPARRVLARGMGAESWMRSADDLSIDLHARLCRRALPWDLAADVRAAVVRDVVIGGVGYPALHGGALVLALAMHGARHGFSRLEWLAAIARLAADPASVREAAALAPTVDARRPLALALLLARDVCGAAVDLPDSLASAVPAVAGAVARVVAMVDGARAELPPHGPETRRFHLALLESPRARRRYRWRTLSDPMLPDVRAVRLPDALAFAYPAVRVARLGVRAVTGARGDDA